MSSPPVSACRKYWLQLCVPESVCAIRPCTLEEIIRECHCIANIADDGLALHRRFQQGSYRPGTSRGSVEEAFGSLSGCRRQQRRQAKSRRGAGLSPAICWKIGSAA